MDNLFLYLIAVILLLISFMKDRAKTKKIILKTFGGFLKLLPQMSFILILIGLSLTLVTPERISSFIGYESGILGVVISIITGAVSLLPSFIAFPLGATMLNNGAGLFQIAGFISALMGIGIVSFPMERKYFGSKFAYFRNIGSLIMTVIFVATLYLVIGDNV